MTVSLLEPGSATAANNGTSSVVAGNASFALDLYQREKSKADNLFFSPYSISVALAMTWAGARGKTELEMARVLHFTLPQADVPRAFAGLEERLQEIEKRKNVQLSVANSLWCERKYSFRETFLELNRKHYRAEVRLVDFVANAEAARQEINAWVERKTQDKIRDLLKPDQVSPLTALVLCNAIYFKGKWLAQFDPKATKTEPFFVTPARTTNVPMMSQKLKFRCKVAADLVLFALPYTGKDLSLVVLLPKTLDGLDSLENQLGSAKLQEWLSALADAPESEATVFLPRFKLNCRLELKDDLVAMGMPSAFGPGADFSGMSRANDLFISAVVHQAFVDVNEEGTEAAAATAVVMSRSASANRPLVLRVDHPFVFLICERQTGNILFLGRVADPTK
jgi:serpin B